MDLKMARFIKQFTQYHLVFKTGIPQSKLSLIERGFVKPKDDEKIKIAKALQLNPEDIEW